MVKKIVIGALWVALGQSSLGAENRSRTDPLNPGVSALVGEGGSPQGLVVPLTMDDFVWMLIRKIKMTS